MEMSSNAIFNWLISEIFCEGAYFIRIELKLIRNHADGSENICVRDFIMRKLKRINVLIYKNNYHSLMRIKQLIRKTKAIYIHVYIYCGGYFVRSIYFNETTRNNCRKKIQLRIKNNWCL